MCGRIDVDAMLEEMPNQLFEEWVAYDSVEPWGSESVKRVIANGAALIANVLGAKIEPEQILGYEHNTESVSPNQAAQMFKGLK